MSIAANPNDLEPVQAMLKLKGNEIGVLSKRLKIPNVEPIQTVELREVQEEEEKQNVALQECMGFLKINEKGLKPWKLEWLVRTRNWPLGQWCTQPRIQIILLMICQICQSETGKFPH